MVGSVGHVDLVDDEDDLLAPAANELEELVLAGGIRSNERGHEKDEIGARYEGLGERLLLALHGVGARRVDDVEKLEQRNGQLMHEKS